MNLAVENITIGKEFRTKTANKPLSLSFPGCEGEHLPRDFYDIHILMRTMGSAVDMATLREALGSTCEKRGNQDAIARWAEVLDDVASDSAMLARWSKYVRKNPYAEGIVLPDCCATAKVIFANVIGQV